MIGLVSCQKRVVAFHIILGTPIGKISARMRENVSLLHRPTRSGLFPFVPGKRFVLVGDSPVDVFPNLVDAVQVVASLDQITVGMFCQALQNLTARTRNDSFIRFIGRHDFRPFIIELSTCLKFRPNRHCIPPIQVIALLRKYLRTHWRTSKKDQ